MGFNNDDLGSVRVASPMSGDAVGNSSTPRAPNTWTVWAMDATSGVALANTARTGRGRR